MTLDEAIEHLEESLADKNKWIDCDECKKEHIQLRDWLNELKWYREKYAVNEL